ncbi:hypothetical protein [Lactovum odontotermitis]
MASAIVADKEIEGSLHTEDKAVSGKEYLESEKQAVKEGRKRRAEQERLNNLKDWQKTRDQNMNFGRGN